MRRAIFARSLALSACGSLTATLTWTVSNNMALRHRHRAREVECRGCARCSALRRRPGASRPSTSALPCTPTIACGCSSKTWMMPQVAAIRSTCRRPEPLADERRGRTSPLKGSVTSCRADPASGRARRASCLSCPWSHRADPFSVAWRPSSPRSCCRPACRP